MSAQVRVYVDPAEARRKLREQEPMSLDEVALMMGISRERVRQIEQRALEKMRMYGGLREHLGVGP